MSFRSERYCYLMIVITVLIVVCVVGATLGQIERLRPMLREGKWATDNRFLKDNYVKDFTKYINKFDKLAEGALPMYVPQVEQITPKEVVDCEDPYFTGDSRGVVFEAVEMGVPDRLKPRVVCFLDLVERHPYVIEWGHDPAISPDYRFICWNSTLGTRVRTTYVYEIPSKRLMAKLGRSREAVWSPDGRFLIYATTGRHPQIWYANVKDFKPKKLFDLEGRQPTLSYDKKCLAYQGRDRKIYVYYLNKGIKERLTNFVSGYETSPSWSPDGKWIVYTHYVDVNRNGKYDLLEEPTQLYVTAVRTHQSFALGGIDETSEPCWSPDGRYIVARYKNPNSVYSCLILITVPSQLLPKQQIKEKQQKPAAIPSPS
ncbi:PD40 domain-containing protein [Candidatus Sumerlaeota bacterium]|nr:PD40 domain-containing protein [Candidatus Sumerlaeota bacterium]